MLYEWTQKCIVSLANQLRAVVDVFCSLRTHQRYWTECWTSHYWNPSNRYHTAFGENQKYIWEQSALLKLSAQLHISEVLLIASTLLLVKTENIYWSTRKMHITMETELCILTAFRNCFSPCKWFWFDQTWFSSRNF